MGCFMETDLPKGGVYGKENRESVDSETSFIKNI